MYSYDRSKTADSPEEHMGDLLKDLEKLEKVKKLEDALVDLGQTLSKLITENKVKTATQAQKAVFAAEFDEEMLEQAGLLGAGLEEALDMSEIAKVARFCNRAKGSTQRLETAIKDKIQKLKEGRR